MLKKKTIKRYIRYIIYLCILTVLTGVVHTGIGLFLVSKAPMGVQWLEKRKVTVTYDSLESPICFFSVCIKAKNVKVSSPYASVQFCPIDLSIQKSLLGNYTIQIDACKVSTLQNCLQITGQAIGTPDFWHITDLSFWKEGRGGIVSGDIDMIGKDMRLEGETEGLSDFAALFMPKDFQFLASLVFSNGKQKISVRTDENYIRIFDVPILPKSVIFRR